MVRAKRSQRRRRVSLRKDFVKRPVACAAALAAASLLLPACSGGGNGGTSPGGTDGGSDATSSVDGGGSDGRVADAGDASSGEDGSQTDGAAPDGAQGDAGELQAVAVIPTSGKPGQMALDTTHDRLYVGLSNDDTDAGTIGGPLGILVLDTTNDSVVTTIASPVASGFPVGFVDLVVDETASLLYGASSQSVYVFDLSTNTLKTSFDVSGGQSALANSLAIDSAGGKLYVGVVPVPLPGDSGALLPPRVVVVDTSNDSIADTILLPDLGQVPEFNGLSLGLDTTNGLLFACGRGVPAVVDSIGTAVAAETDAGQLSFGDVSLSLPCLDGSGNAGLVTVSADGGAGAWHSLEPQDVPLPSGFVPESAFMAGAMYVIVGFDKTTGGAAFEVVLPGVSETSPISKAGPFAMQLFSNYFSYSGGVADPDGNAYLSAVFASSPPAGTSLSIQNNVYHFRFPTVL